jgi:hypothetical protein
LTEFQNIAEKERTPRLERRNGIAHRRAKEGRRADRCMDDEHHRWAFAVLPGLTQGPERGKHPRLQHFAFEYVNLDELLIAKHYIVIRNRWREYWVSSDTTRHPRRRNWWTAVAGKQ